MRLERCDECGESYPPELVTHYFSGNARFQRSRCCGVCALALSNKEHGLKRRKFQGELAEAMRQDAIAYRLKRKSADAS